MLGMPTLEREKAKMNTIERVQKYPSLPTAKDASLAKEASQMLGSLVNGDSDVNITVNRGEAKIEAVIPAAALQMIVELLAHMSQGNAVTVIPTGAEFTTQQAAHFLNVSRPFLIGLLNKEEIAFHMVGRHRRIKFEDLKAYKENRDKGQMKALDDLAAISQRAAKVIGEGY